MSVDASVPLRRLCYRLRRQGMLELDAWLEPLAAHLSQGADPALTAAASALLAMESPQLLALMHGEQALPAILVPWLALRR